MADPITPSWMKPIDGKSTHPIPIRTLPTPSRIIRQRTKASDCGAGLTGPGRAIHGSANKAKAKGRPRSVTLPAPSKAEQMGRGLSFNGGLPTPGLSWSNTSIEGRLLSPALSVESPLQALPVHQFDREGSVLSSGSSTEGQVPTRPILQPRSQSARSSITRSSLAGRHGSMHAAEPRARGLSLSLVVDAEGQAALQHEVQQTRDESIGMRGEAMRRMASFAGSDISVTRPLGGLTLAASGRSESLIRTASQQTDFNSMLPLTPSSGSFDHKYVSPSQIRRPSLMQTPESSWDSPESHTDETQSPPWSFENSLPHDKDARAALQQVYGRRRGVQHLGQQSSSLPAGDFFINMMPTSPPPATTHRARHRHPLTCDACDMVFRTARAHQVHISGGCNVKQAPFLASDFLEALDVGSHGLFELAQAPVHSSVYGESLFDAPPEQRHAGLLASPLLSGDEDAVDAPGPASEPRKRTLMNASAKSQQNSPSQLRTSKRLR